MPIATNHPDYWLNVLTVCSSLHRPPDPRHGLAALVADRTEEPV
jgi:hypothetical protein